MCPIIQIRAFQGSYVRRVYLVAKCGNKLEKSQNRQIISSTYYTYIFNQLAKHLSSLLIIHNIVRPDQVMNIHRISIRRQKSIISSASRDSIGNLCWMKIIIEKINPSKKAWSFSRNTLSFRHRFQNVTAWTSKHAKWI